MRQIGIIPVSYTHLQKEQATKRKHTDIINRFEIRLRDTKAVHAVEELLLTYNPVSYTHLFLRVSWQKP